MGTLFNGPQTHASVERCAADAALGAARRLKVLNISLDFAIVSTYLCPQFWFPFSSYREAVHRQGWPSALLYGSTPVSPFSSQKTGLKNEETQHPITKRDGDS